MVLSKEEFFDYVKRRAGDAENPSPEDLEFIENMTDTYNDIVSNQTGAEWEGKYKDLMKRYRERFFDGVPEQKIEEDTIEEEKEDTPEEKGISDLFEEDKKE